MPATNYCFDIVNNNELTARRPKALIILCGWYGSTPKNVQKYAQIYQDLGCVTIAGSLPDFAVLTKNDSQIDNFSFQLMKEANKLLRKYNSLSTTLKVIVHAFSNGGGFVLQGMERGAGIRAGADEQQEVEMFQEAMVAQIFDSSPAYYNMVKGIRATRAAIPNFFIKNLATFFGIIVFSALHLVTVVSCKPPKGEEFWQDLLKSPCKKQLFIYSQVDQLTDSDKVEEFIQQRKESGSDVSTQKFDDSPHCQHLRFHPAEYIQAVKRFLDSIIIED